MERALWLLLHCLFDVDGIKLTENSSRSWQEGGIREQECFEEKKKEEGMHREKNSLGNAGKRR